MSDRLEELRRQRALVQTHLDWLDREIAAHAPPPETTPPVPREAPVRAPVYTLRHSAAAILAHAAAPASAPVASRSAASADAILDEYRVPPDTLKTDVRKGCFLYFFVALAVVAVVVTGLYFALSARHP